MDILFDSAKKAGAYHRANEERAVMAAFIRAGEQARQKIADRIVAACLSHLAGLTSSPTFVWTPVPMTEASNQIGPNSSSPPPPTSE